MEVSQIGLALYMSIAVAVGLLLGAAYDVFAILPALCGRVFNRRLYEKFGEIKLPLIGHGLKRKNSKAGRQLTALGVFLHDLLFMVTAGCVIALLTYRFNDGNWRVGSLLCLTVGFTVYRLLFRKPILAATELLRFGVKCTAAYAVFFIVTPVRFVVSKVVTTIRKIAEKSRKRRLERRIKHYTERRTKRLLKLSVNGCLNVKIKEEGKSDRSGSQKTKQNNPLDDDTSARRGGHRRRSKPDAVQSAAKGDSAANTRKGRTPIPG